MKIESIFLIVTIFIYAVLSGCAKMGSLTGGAKDEAPPVLLSAKPENYTVQFNEEQIELIFNEFIALKDINQQLIVSPPLPKKPIVRVKNKTLIIELNNELREKTTYTLNFGKALTDNNEGNALTNFEFVFSTGEYLDSLSIQGTLISAFNLQPSKDPFIVALYDQLDDSIPLKEIPVYVGKSDEKGNFRINNIKEDTFRIFALKDLNNNLIFDLPNEEIAFSDSLLFLTNEFLSSLTQSIRDSMVNISQSGSEKITTSADTINEDMDIGSEAATDSMIVKEKLPSLFVDLIYFTEKKNRQYMVDYERTAKESIRLCFSLPFTDIPFTDILYYEEDKDWYLPEFNSGHDTLVYWIRDTLIMNLDSLFIGIDYPATDSTGSLTMKRDTLSFITRKVVEKPSRGKSATVTKSPALIVNSPKNNGVLDLHKGFPLQVNFPVMNWDSTKAILYEKPDSVEFLSKYKLIRDSSNYRNLSISSDWKEKTRYRLSILPGSFIDLFNNTNDSLQFSFSTRDKSYYGLLKLSLSDVKSPLLVQLMNEKEVVLSGRSIDTDGELVFDFLSPAKYKVKIIFDDNRNGEWDTGDYLRKIQPEKVMYYSGEINVRSNWDLEIKQSVSSK